MYIASDPTEASVVVDRSYVGKTPIAVDMSRGDNHLVRIELEGYMPYEIEIKQHVSGWVFGNLWGSLI